MFLVRATCEIRLVSYSSKHASPSLFEATSCVYLHAKFRKYRSYMDINRTCPMTALLSRHSLCGLELNERSDWRAMAPEMHCDHSLTHFFLQREVDSMWSSFKSVFFNGCSILFPLLKSILSPLHPGSTLK